MKKHTLDASGIAPGRVATQVAVLLMGKDRTDFARNKLPEVEVEVTNASGMKIEARKLRDKTYSHHSGYPGGLKTHTMQHVVDTKGAKEVLRRAVSGMLPKNKLRAVMMRRLTIKD